MSTTADHDAIERELHQLQMARLNVDWQSQAGAVALAESFSRERELWHAVVCDAASAPPLLRRAAIGAEYGAAESAKFWRQAADEKHAAGRPA